MGTFFNHPAGNNQNKNTAPPAGLSGTGNPTCCARLAPRQGGDGYKNAAPRAGLCGTGAGLLRRKEKDEGKKEGDALKKIRTGDQKDRSYCSAVTLTLPSAAKEMPSADWGV